MNLAQLEYAEEKLQEYDKMTFSDFLERIENLRLERTDADFIEFQIIRAKKQKLKGAGHKYNDFITKNRQLHNIANSAARIVGPLTKIESGITVYRVIEGLKEFFKHSDHPKSLRHTLVTMPKQRSGSRSKRPRSPGPPGLSPSRAGGSAPKRQRPTPTRTDLTAGFESGYEVGYETGSREGYEAGYKAGLQAGRKPCNATHDYLKESPGSPAQKKSRRTP